MVCHVIKVDCRRLFFQKIDALHPNLHKFAAVLYEGRRLNWWNLFLIKLAPGGFLNAVCLFFGRRGYDDLVNAVGLVWLILLGCDDLVEVDEAGVFNIVYLLELLDLILDCDFGWLEYAGVGNVLAVGLPHYITVRFYFLRNRHL